ncbi:MAG TPA: TonB-dependent receptor plug domain-containing protein [Gemmatimonadaceae bacterium]|nr:TonB-dependent receptor plug domain-containing protein [Gemmatimonadaceae bacterium]
MPRSMWRAALGLATAVLLGLSAASPARAQGTGTIKGRVVDAAGQRPLGDVQVTVGGTTLGGVTNLNGEYTISGVPEGAHPLSTRRLGYTRRTQTVTVPANATVTADFSLSQAASQLEAVVVTGTAGAVEKRTVGNAVTQLDVADVTAKTNVTNVMEVLQARSPGVQIQAGSGSPGTAPSIMIRGASSLSVTPPVVYIDGVRMSTAGLGNFNPSGQGLSANSGGQGANAWDLVNPDDIESIEIIKGPAAATLYGADAAGGVIQIITKKGSRGQQQAQWGARVEYGKNDLGSVTLPDN